MSIQLVDNFQVNVASPIDSRIVASGSAARNRIQYKYEGLRVFDTSDGVPYVWRNGTWSGENSSSITGNGTANFITKYSSSNTLSDSVIAELSDTRNTNVLIGYSSPSSINNQSPTARLQVNGNIRTNTGFYGDGSNITNLNANNIASGNLSVGRLSLSGSANWILTRNTSTAIWTDPSNVRVGGLSTPRSLWGQSFDGTGNISGNMTGVGTIAFGSNQNFKATLSYNTNKDVTFTMPDMGTRPTATVAVLDKEQLFIFQQAFGRGLKTEDRILVQSTSAGGIEILNTLANSGSNVRLTKGIEFGSSSEDHLAGIYPIQATQNDNKKIGLSFTTKWDGNSDERFAIFANGGISIVNNTSVSAFAEFSINASVDNRTTRRTIASVNYDRIFTIVRGGDPYSGARLIDGYLQIVVKFGNDTVWFWQSSFVNNVVEGGQHPNVFLIIPAGVTVTVDFVRGGGVKSSNNDFPIIFLGRTWRFGTGTLRT